MNTKSVKLIKKHDRNSPQLRSTVKLGAGPNRWSTAVRSWVVEFQKHGGSESLPTFDSLFKDALPHRDAQTET